MNDEQIVQSVLRPGWEALTKETSQERERRSRRACARVRFEQQPSRVLSPQLGLAFVTALAMILGVIFKCGWRTDNKEATITVDRTPITTTSSSSTVVRTAPPPAAIESPPPSRPAPPKPIAATAKPIASTPSASSAPSATAVAEEDPWTAAEEALKAGDRAAAEKHLADLLRTLPPSHPRHARASFLLAELELARGGGGVVDARARLQPLMHSGDPQMAEDAASVLARSFPSALDRSEIWSRYLATHPPSPRRERALLERARAFERAGKQEAARADVHTLCKTAKSAGLNLEECGSRSPSSRD